MVEALDLVDAEPPAETLGWPLQMAVAGLTSVADWIASSLTYGGDASDARAYLQEARRRCAARLDSLGWHRREALTSECTFNAVFPAIATPRPLQRAMEAALGDASGPTLLLVEAPMGEGKTEAALLAHCVLQARNGHRGLYFALPTQATGNAMFTRLRRFLEGFGSGRAFDIQLVHGLAALNQDAQRLRGPVLAGVDDGSNEEASELATVRAAEWFSARKRALLSEYGAGTVDQALVSVLPVRHQFVRMFGLANRVVVLDEVHAYDTYTSGLIADLLRWLRALGSSAVVMSATLPASTRQKLISAWGAPASAAALPAYPRITRVDADGQRDVEVAAFGHSTRRSQVQLHKIGAEVEHLVAEALAQTEHGGCLLVLVNTVDRAQVIYSALAAHAGVAEVTRLFHARFPAGQRQTIEDDLVRDFGPDAIHRPQRAIVVATQVAEQSLDVDFDALISDLAPVDLLLQRLGRVHRHCRDGQRPAHLQQPCLWVAGLGKYPELPKRSLYPMVGVLRTAQLLAERHQLDLPVDIDALVQACYAKDTLPSPSAEWEDAMRSAMETEMLAEKDAEAKCIQNSIGAPDDVSAYVNWRSDKEDDESAYAVHPAMRAVTRLGADALRVLLVYRGASGVSLLPGGPPIATSGVNAATLLASVVPVSHRGLVSALRKLPVPDWASKDSLLRGVAVLELDGTGAVALGPWQVQLDARLGLRISRDVAVAIPATAIRCDEDME